MCLEFFQLKRLLKSMCDGQKLVPGILLVFCGVVLLFFWVFRCLLLVFLLEILDVFCEFIFVYKVFVGNLWRVN